LSALPATGTVAHPASDGIPMGLRDAPKLLTFIVTALGLPPAITPY
jgi:hypothetical protein